MTRALDIYHRLPAPGQAVVATGRGLWLRWWRYGRGFDDLVAAAIVRDRWSDEAWMHWASDRLGHVLRRAHERVPYYRTVSAGQFDWRDLSAWPILEKQTLRDRPRDFLAEDSSRRSLLEEHTSGTSGTPLTLWSSRRTVQEWYALFEARARRWYDVSRHDRWANIGGQLIVPYDRKRPPFWVWNAALQQLYLSSYHVTPDTAPAYVDALRRHRVVHLLGYPSAIASLAIACREAGVTPAPLVVVVTNAEPLSPSQRHTISEAFGCPVRDTYGMSEMVCGASECEFGRLHLWPEAGIVEVLDDCGHAATTGRLVVTGLLNDAMPLVRYAVGDRVTLGANVDCRCGRTLPVLDAVEGREDDVVIGEDGRRIGRLDPVFKADLPVREAQIVQDRLGHLVVRIVPLPGYTDSDRADLVRRLRDRVGDLSIDVEQLDEIPRGANGKFRAVVSLVTSTRDGPDVT